MIHPEDKDIDTIRVRRGKMDSIDVFEVTDHELGQLEKGGDGGIYLNFALSLASLAVAFVIALITTNIQSDRQFAVFVLITLVGFVGAAILTLLWWNSRKSVKAVIGRIKSRMPAESAVDKDAESREAVNKAI